MGIPTRAQVDAFCGAPATRWQRIAGILAPVILLGCLATILIIWHRLPEEIPTHYNAAGEIDGYGGRGVLLLMPIIGLVMDLVIAIVGRFPRSWNVGVRVTVLNRTKVYRLVRDLMAELRLTMAVFFGGFSVYQASLPERFAGWVVLIPLLLMSIPLLRYFTRVK